METTYTLLGVNGTKCVATLDLPKEPGYDVLAKIIRPLIGRGRDFERVNVLHEGKYTDMFVDDSGLLDHLPINVAATAIYRNNVLTHEKGAIADDLPAIHGNAILFSRKVWY